MLGGFSLKKRNEKFCMNWSDLRMIQNQVYDGVLTFVYLFDIILVLHRFTNVQYVGYYQLHRKFFNSVLKMGLKGAVMGDLC